MSLAETPKELTEIRESWQSKALRSTVGTGMGMILLSIMADAYPDAIEILLAVTFPGFRGITFPALTSAAKIDRTGAIVADMVDRYGRPLRDIVIFGSLIDMRDELRRAADQIGLNDQDREQMFICARNWVKADRRLDPRMDPKDPDAKRYALN